VPAEILPFQPPCSSVVTGQAMVPTLPPEMLASAFELVCYVFTAGTALLSFLVTLRL
jgi:hypothetical protein